MFSAIFSSPGQSPGRAIVLPPALALALALAAAAAALAKSLTLNFFYVMSKALLGKLSCPCDRSCFKKGQLVSSCLLPFQNGVCLYRKELSSKSANS